MTPLLLLLAAALAAAPVPAREKPAKKGRPSAAAIEEGERRMARGAAGVKAASGPADLKDAAAEFEAAATADPRLSDALYNAGVTYAKAGEHAAAVRNLKRYVETAKGAELKAAKSKLAEEEYLLEKQQRSAKRLEGTWTTLHDGEISTVVGHHLSDWTAVALGEGRYRFTMATIIGDPSMSAKVYEFRVEGEDVSGTFSWDGKAPSGGRRLCDPVSSPLTGKLQKDGAELSLRYESRMFETGCGSIREETSLRKL